MTKLLEIAFAEAKQLPPERQDELARTIMQIVHSADDEIELTDEDRAAIETGLAEADRGEFASEEQLQAILNKYRA